MVFSLFWFSLSSFWLVVGCSLLNECCSKAACKRFYTHSPKTKAIPKPWMAYSQVSAQWISRRAHRTLSVILQHVLDVRSAGELTYACSEWSESHDSGGGVWWTFLHTYEDSYVCRYVCGPKHFVRCCCHQLSHHHKAFRRQLVRISYWKLIASDVTSLNARTPQYVVHIYVLAYVHVNIPEGN